MTTPLLAAFLDIILCAPASGQPGPLERHSAVYDASRDRMVVFGGYDGTDQKHDIWTTSIANPLRWDHVIPLGNSPSGRFSHTATWDPSSNRMVVFGGWSGSGVVDETWALSLGTVPEWTRLLPTGKPPPARQFHTAVSDPVRNRILIFGGEESGLSTVTFNDVWALSLDESPRWDLIVPKGAPPSKRTAHSAIYDPLRDRMLVFGGFRLNNEVWELSLADTAWRLLTTTGTPPSRRSEHAAIYDPIRDRMIVFGGSEGNRRLNDVWALSLAGTPAWSVIYPDGAPPASRSLHSAIYDSLRDAMVTFGGFPADTQTWALAFAPAPLWSPSQPVLALSTFNLLLPSITIGDTVSVSLSNPDIQIATLTDGFTVESAAPYEVRVNALEHASRIEVERCTPDVDAADQDEIAIAIHIAQGNPAARGLDGADPRGSTREGSSDIERQRSRQIEAGAHQIEVAIAIDIA